MRALGFLGIALLLVVAALGLFFAVQGGDWRGVALMLFMAVLLIAFAKILWHGRKLERQAGSGQTLAQGWYGESVSAFFKHQVAKSPEGLVLIVGSALSLALAALALASPAFIGLPESRSAVSAVLFAGWPILAFVGYVRICGPTFNSSIFTIFAMLCIVAAPFFLAYR